MKLEIAEQKQIEIIVAISKTAFDSDIIGGAMFFTKKLGYMEVKRDDEFAYYQKELK